MIAQAQASEAQTAQAQTVQDRIHPVAGFAGAVDDAGPLSTSRWAPPEAPMDMPRQLLERPRGQGALATLWARLTRRTARTGHHGTATRA